MPEWRTETVEDCLVRLPLAALKKLQTQDYRFSGLYPIIDQGQALIAGWTDDESGLITQGLPVVVFGDHTRAFKFIDFPFVRGADGTQVLKPKFGIDPLFFFYALRAVDLPSRGYNRHFKALKEKEIAVPSDAEQADISRSLKLVEDTLAVQDQELQALEHCKRAAMRALFTRGLKGEAQKETEIGPVPESWDVVDFGAVREWLQYGTSTRCTYVPTNFPVLRIPNIEPGRVNAEDIKFGTLRADEAARYRLEDGDLIFIRTNGVIERLGACAVYAGEPEGALFASYLIRARLKLDWINPYFATHFFGSELGTSIVAGRATPAADGKYNLNTGTIDRLPIPLPPTLDEQREIVAVLDAIDRKIDLHRRKRAVLDELFKALLHKLMTGEIRVADLDLSALTPRREAEAATA
ncbi:MAG TPA: restriction endonuclease subunit S [Accumulibacter sp.]|nr:restriction endonuclease subunit S [Accumulibacter sp.]